MSKKTRKRLTPQEARRLIEKLEIYRNEMECSIDWQFTTADARIKLKRLYPAIRPINGVRSPSAG